MLQNRIPGIFLLAVTAAIPAVAPSPAAAGWENAGEFRGTASYSVTVDGHHETAEQEITLKKNARVHIRVTGTDFDGAYYHSKGTISGTISTHMVMISKKDGSTMDSRFTGKISEEFGKGKRRGPDISIERKKGLYTISLPSAYATGTATVSITNFGTRSDPDSKDETHPMVPQAYRSGGGGRPYERNSGMITGGYTDDITLPLTPFPMPVHIEGSWNFRLGKPDYKVVITDPSPGDPFVYEESKELNVMATAAADPKSHEPDIEPWYMEPIEGADLEIDPSVGTIGHFIFRNYPEENDQFGEKAMTADNSDPVKVRVFFPMWCSGDFCRNNPEGRDPDWFYYWKQGPVSYMHDFEYDDGIDYYGYFRPPADVYLGKRAGMKEEVERFTISTSRGTRTFSFPASEPIDTCARTVRHELKHREIYEAYGRSSPWQDTDGDGLPNWLERALEPEYGFDDHNADTHKLFGKEYISYGDQELLCWLAEVGVLGDHGRDWSFPGTQAK